MKKPTKSDVVAMALLIKYCLQAIMCAGSLYILAVIGAILD